MDVKPIKTVGDIINEISKLKSLVVSINNNDCRVGVKIELDYHKEVLPLLNAAMNLIQMYENLPVEKE